MNTLYTKAQLFEKGVKRKDILRLIKRTEAVCNYFFRLQLVRDLSDNEQKEWDTSLNRWDHFKATLTNWDK